MTTDDFRRIALSFPGAEEVNGLGYPNFRAGRKSFATIENSMAVIRLNGISKQRSWRQRLKICAGFRRLGKIWQHRCPT
jgi:hypothetical protein